MKILPKQGSEKNKLKQNRYIKPSPIGFLDAVAQFDAELDEIPFEGEPGDENDFKKLAELIGKLGDNLGNSPTPENFLSYKKHIRLFINQVKDNLKILNISSRTNFSKQKLYQVVESVDKNLSELAEMVLNREQDRISYLKLTDYIKGLIVDLTL